MGDKFTYIAFISYKREDKKWAQWLHRKLENYKLPSSVRKADTTLPEKIRPVFRDITDLEPGVLADKIREGLKQSRFLIVICSPRVVESKYVNEEIEEFIRQGRQQSIIPFIIEGSPNAGNPETECFPPALRRLSSKQELLGANVNEMGRNAAAVKVVSRMFDMRFDSLWQRHERERRRKKRIAIVSLLLTLLVILGVIVSFRTLQHTTQNIRENYLLQRIGLLIDNRDFDLAERLCLDIIDNTPQTNRPALNRFEYLFRTALFSEYEAARPEYEFDCKLYKKPFINDKYFIDYANDYCMDVSDDGQKIATVFQDRLIRIFNPFSVYNHIIEDNDYNDYTNIIISAQNPKAPTLNYKTLTYGLYTEYKLKVRNLLYDTEFTIECERVHETPEVSVNEGFIAIDINIEKNRIVTASGDHMIRIWSADHGELLHEWNARKSPPLDGEEIWYDGFSDIRWASFNADATKIIFVYCDNSIRIWDAESGEELHASYQGKEMIYDIFCTPDNKKIIARAGSSIYIYNAATNRKIHTLTGHTGLITYLSVLDSRTVLSISMDNTIRIWDIDKGIELHRLTGHDKNICDYQISPDKKILVTSSYDGTIRIWDIESGEELQNITRHNNNYYSDSVTGYSEFVALSPDMSKIAAVYNDSSADDDNRIIIWDIKTGERIREIEIQTTLEALVDIEFSEDGHDITVITKYSIETFSIEDDSQLLLNGHSSSIDILKFNRDASLLASKSFGGTICLWDTYDGTLLLRLDNFAYSRPAIKFSNDNKYFYALSSDDIIHIFEIESGECVFRSQPSEEIHGSPIFDNSDAYLIFVSNDDTVCVWDIEHEQIRHSFNANDSIKHLLCTDNNTIAIQTYNDMQLWDIDSGTNIANYHFDTNVVLLNGDNDRIYWYQPHENTIHVWESKTNRETVLQGHYNSINMVQSSPNGQYLISSSYDRTVRVWDMETGVELQTFKEEYDIQYCRFSTDNRTIIYASRKDLRLRDFPPLQELIDKARERFKDQPFTDEDRKMYYLQ